MRNAQRRAGPPAGKSHYVESFPARVTAACRVLVLGSMPGQRSLAEQRYYAHPHNLFWPFMQEICGVPAAADYPDRLAQLNAAGIGLWDVLQGCERPGSLDSAIAPASEIANPIAELLLQRGSIRAIAFNGGKAWQAYRRHVLPTIPAARRASIAECPLPSTSPAHASVPRQEKLRLWLSLRDFLG